MNDPKTRVGRIRLWKDLLSYLSEQTGEDPYSLAALMWRETHCGFAPGYHPKGSADGWGDKGNGYGLFQIDRRYHRGFVNSADANDPRKQGLYACRILREARDAFKRSAANVTGEMLERCTFAAYNAGFGRVYHAVMSEFGDPDSVTTGKNYSAYVLTLATALRRIYPNLFGTKNVG